MAATVRFVTWSAVLGACVSVLAAGCATGSGTPIADTHVSLSASPPAPGGTAPSESASTPAAPQSSGAAAFPVACASLTAQGDYGSPGPSEVSLDQLGTAVGFPVSSAVLDTQSALGFRGYEGCRYQFTTPGGGGQLDVSVVIGTDPTTWTNETAAQDFADTKTQSMPRSERGCIGDCKWAAAATPGIGDSALTMTQTGGDTVVVALKGDLYIEVGPGDLKLEREIALAKLLAANLH
ncbi:MAG TPA: hypothetical protein VGZ32_19355 [Actinocrinis sp.]|uniref:hypothetical protein n=1 Tax=Actinocrinis sp. TaxID=1920516 RepID=UPI002DDD885F|nr:hypothetical protein [Actinocrinis sp.]HEV3172512.1 hypothetical protein [Actinocrinis sp.]